MNQRETAGFFLSAQVMGHQTIRRPTEYKRFKTHYTTKLPNPQDLAMPHARGPSKLLIFWTPATHRSPRSAKMAEPYKPVNTVNFSVKLLDLRKCALK